MSRKHPTKDIQGRLRRITGLNVGAQMARIVKQDIMGDAQQEHIREFQTLRAYASLVQSQDSDAIVKVT